MKKDISIKRIIIATILGLVIVIVFILIWSCIEYCNSDIPNFKLENEITTEE